MRADGRRQFGAGLRDASITMQSRLVTMGYMNARVSEAKPTFTEDRRGVDLFVDIETGVRTFVTAVEFSGMENIPAERLSEELDIRVGEPLR